MSNTGHCLTDGTYITGANHDPEVRSGHAEGYRVRSFYPFPLQEVKSQSSSMSKVEIATLNKQTVTSITHDLRIISRRQKSKTRDVFRSFTVTFRSIVVLVYVLYVR